MDSGAGGAFSREIPEVARRLRGSLSVCHSSQGAGHSSGTTTRSHSIERRAFGTGQAYESLLLRMFGHPLKEVRATRI